MSEICLKFFISTLPLRSRSGFETGSVMGSWPGGEQASGHFSPGDPVSLLRLGQWGVVGLQPQDGDGEGVWGCFPSASGAGCCIGTLPGMAPSHWLLPGAASSLAGSIFKHPETI